MFETYLLPVLLFIGLGLIAGLLLSLASALFGVKTDEKAVAVREVLPGINCGACGFQGCDAYAKAVAAGNTATNRCIPGGDAASKKISEILKTEYEDVEEMVAYVRCRGVGDAVGKKYDYSGTPTCAGANMLYSGNSACAFGCLGFGDCVKACQFDAISVIDGVAVVDAAKCTGCKRCTLECPKGLIAMRPLEKPVFVACANRQSGKATRAVCKNGCIACRRCEKETSGAFTVNGNLAQADFSFEASLAEKGVTVCPVGCIVKASEPPYGCGGGAE